MRARTRDVMRAILAIAAATAMLFAGSGLAGARSTPSIRRSTVAGARAVPRQANAIVPAAVSVDLCAKAGTVTLPGPTVVPIWGYALKPTGVDCADVDAAIPGPVLEMNVGDTLTVTLHNALSENTSISLPGQVGAGEATPGNTRTYVFTASNPGTFLYQSFSNPVEQVPMGLFGALVVRPAPGQAYGPGTTFDQEAILVLSEIDPDLNTAVGGGGSFDMTGYHPTFRLINGEAHPDTDPIVAGASDHVLIRYLNAGLEHHTMGLLGVRQTIVAREAFALPFPVDAVAETVPTGSTVDAIVELPATSLVSYPLYNTNLFLANVNSAPGGMLTFITVV